LAGRISAMVDGATDQVVGASKHLGANPTKIVAVVAGIVAVTAIVVYLLAGDKNGNRPGPAAPAGSRTLVDYHWDFNKTGVPPEFKALGGTLRQVPGMGSDGTGCLQLEGYNPEIIIDVPIDNLPVIVTWNCRSILPLEGGVALGRAFWFPVDNAISLKEISGKWDETYHRSAKYGTWEQNISYITKDYGDFWRGSRRFDLTLWNAIPTGRISLIFVNGHQVDDLRIRSISSDKLPDASNYLRLAGTVRTAKDGDPVIVRVTNENGRPTNVVAKFYRRVDRWSSDKEEYPPRTSAAQ
ncbi:MAG: hypothetical protein C0404_14585, partial [Verrucomicrobia bacterium]|nr:hypothetical protein [Verrucomicrobiota bacterium]